MSKTDNAEPSRQEYDGNHSFLTLTYQENIYSQLEAILKEGSLFEGIIIDLMQTGFSMQLDLLTKFISYGKKLLNPHGVMLFIKGDGALSLSRDDPGGGLVINAYDSPYGALTRYPMLADHACATVHGIDRKRITDGGSTLTNHILLSSVPVLTATGKKTKGDYTLPVTQNWVIQLIDDYSTVESITHKLESRQLLSSQESLCILQELENERLVFPIFTRLQFLANCYQSRKPFRLGRYMVACGVLTESQLQELLERQQEEGWSDSQRTLLGVLAVRSGLISMRELQVLLADQYLYGGYHKLSSDILPGGGGMVDVNVIRDSMIGSLGAIDPPGLLQSLNTAGKTGLLTSEDRDKIMLVAFVNGRPTHARLDQLRGFDALAEFITTWSEGIFVFRDKGISSELDATTELKESLDRVLLDSALFHDHINQVVSTLAQGRDSVLERVKDFDQRWQDLSSTKLEYLDESEVTADDRVQIARLARRTNGLATLDEVVRGFDSWPTHKIMKGIEVLNRNAMLVHQTSSLFKPLNVLQQIVAQMRDLIGAEQNKQILHSSLHYAHGDSSAKGRFQIDQEGCVSVNLSQLNESGVSASVVLPELRQWMEAYLAYCRQKVDPRLVDEMVSRTIRENT